MKTLILQSENNFNYLLLSILLIPLLAGCYSSELKVAEYDFIYKGESYTIRSSYCRDNPSSCNQLIGKDFVAVDINQDRIMDKVKIGNISLSEAQEIYDYCLTLLENAGKLTEIEKKLNQYELTEDKYTYIIKSFVSINGSNFAEFTIVDKRDRLGKFKDSIFIDKDADGNLDEVLKGGLLIEEAQKFYSRTIARGIEQTKLEYSNGILIVK